MQRLTIDLVTQRFVKSADDSTSPASLSIKRGDETGFEVQFIRDAAGQELAAATTFRFGVKTLTNLSGAYLIFTADVNKTGQGETALYSFSPGTNTLELNSALCLGTSAEKASIRAGLEIEWTTPDSKAHSTDIVAITIYNDLNRGNEGVPAEANPSYPAPQELERVSSKAQPNGYASLGADGKVPSAQLPDLSLKAEKQVAARYRFKADGTFQLWNPDQNKWCAVTVGGTAGNEVLRIGAGEN